MDSDKKKITRHIFIVQYLYLKKKVARKRIQSSKRDVESSKIPFQMLLKREQHLLAQAKNTRKERLEMPQPFELAVPLSKIQHKKKY